LNEKQGVPSSLYDKKYYLKRAGGLWSFNLIAGSKGKIFPKYYDNFYKLTDIKPGMKILDIGCGRGEFVVFSATQGAYSIGIDYSKDAIDVAKNLAKLCVENLDEKNLSKRISFIQADVKALPFSDKSFDRLVSRSVAEHLFPWEFAQMLCEIKNILKKDGLAFICTNPNIWYKKYALPLVNLIKKKFPILGKVSGEFSDKNYQKEFTNLHVNEQGPLGIKEALVKSGFKTKVKFEPRFSYRKEALLAHYGKKGYLLFMAIYLLEHLPFVKWIFCDTIICEAKPKY